MKIFQRASLLFLISTITGYLVIGQNTETAPTVTKDKALAKSLLWEVSGNGLEASSFVFGTIHIIGAEDFFFPDIANETLLDAKQVAFEIDMDEMSDMSSMFSIFQNAMMKDGQTLKSLLSEEDYQVVNEHFSSMGLPMMMLERIKPMFLSILSSGDMGMGGDMQSGGMKSYEMEIYEKAQAANLKVEGLETMDFQMSLFDSIPYEAQAQMLVESIKGPTDESSELDEMTRIYKDQDIEAMYKMIQGDSEGLSDFENLLVKKRNENWIPKMEKMMGDGQTFFAVGAGHLGGPHGVIRLLKKQGYSVEPLMNIKGVRRI